MSNWDMERIRKIAGLPMITEGFRDDDEGDGLSAAERELAKKADGDLKKKGISVGKVDPDKDLQTLAKKRAAKEKKAEERADSSEEAEKKAAAAEKKSDEDKAPKADDKEEKSEKPAPKKEEPKKEEVKKEEPKKEEPKAEEKAEEAKRRGRAINPEAKRQKAIAWINSHKNEKRGVFIKWAADNLQMTHHYASALFAKHNPKSGRTPTEVKECWILVHPQIKSFILGENRELNQYQWIDPSSDFDPMIFETEAEAEKMAKYMAEWKSQVAIIEKVDFDDEE
jgi:chemotaxis protein histidine kinase CheA